MKNVAKTVMMLSLALAVAIPLAAADKEKKKKKGKKGGFDPTARVIQGLKKKVGDLSEEQTKKLQDLAAQWGPKLQEARKGFASKQREINEARKKATDAGKKGRAAVEAGLSVLNEDEKKAFTAFQKLQREFNAAARGVLTPEQLKKAGGNRKGKGKDKAKKGKKKKDSDS